MKSSPLNTLLPQHYFIWLPKERNNYFMKNTIRFTSTQKPDGEEYKKIAYWNRFIRTKTETLIMALLFVISIACCVYRLSTGTMDTFWALLSLVFFCYPFMIIMQFNTSIRYHLRHRNPAEICPCEFSIMENGILIDVPEHDVRDFFRYDEFTSVYTNVGGYIMMFKKNKVLVMLKKADIPEGCEDNILDLISNGITTSCKVSKFI